MPSNCSSFCSLLSRYFHRNGDVHVMSCGVCVIMTAFSRIDALFKSAHSHLGWLAHIILRLPLIKQLEIVCHNTMY